MAAGGSEGTSTLTTMTSDALAETKMRGCNGALLAAIAT
jgi:hypothetical protein